MERFFFFFEKWGCGGGWRLGGGEGEKEEEEEKELFKWWKNEVEGAVKGKEGGDRVREGKEQSSVLLKEPF